MKLITVEASFSPEDTIKAVEAVEAQQDAVRAMEGCAHYAIYRSEGALAIVQKWQTMDAFEVYRKSEAFAGLIEALKPLMTAPPMTTIAEADTLNT